MSKTRIFPVSININGQIIEVEAEFKLQDGSWVNTSAINFQTNDQTLPVFIPVDIDGPLGHLDHIVIYDASVPEVEEEPDE